MPGMQTVVSNATRWDTFEHMLDQNALPRSEQLFRQRYKKSPSFISIHMGVKAAVLPEVPLCSCLAATPWDPSPLSHLYHAFFVQSQGFDWGGKHWSPPPPYSFPTFFYSHHTVLHSLVCSSVAYQASQVTRLTPDNVSGDCGARHS